jgi:tetrahydromethanopterin S-methyltransferase subunit D
LDSAGIGGGILLDPSIQIEKFIAVWTQTEPLPLVVYNPAPIILGLMAFGIGHALIYHWLAVAWPTGIKARAWRMAILIFFLSFI